MLQTEHVAVATRRVIKRARRSADSVVELGELAFYTVEITGPAAELKNFRAAAHLEEGAPAPRLLGGAPVSDFKVIALRRGWIGFSFESAARSEKIFGPLVRRYPRLTFRGMWREPCGRADIFDYGYELLTED